MTISLPPGWSWIEPDPSTPIKFEIVSPDDLNLLFLNPKNAGIVRDLVANDFAETTREQEMTDQTCGEIVPELWVNGGGLKQVTILWCVLVPCAIAA